jgi:hypothetical protein
MIKRLKLIFYITSALILGMLTIWQIYSVRRVLSSVDPTKLDSELNEVKNVVALWKDRKPFDVSSVQTATPSSSSPTVVIKEDKTASGSGEN